MSIFIFYFVSSVNPILNFTIVITNEIVKLADFYFCTLCTNGLKWRYSGIRREKKGGIMETGRNMEAGK